MTLEGQNEKHSSNEHSPQEPSINASSADSNLADVLPVESDILPSKLSPPLIFLLGGLLLLIGGALVIWQSIGSEKFWAGESCLGIVASADGWQVLDSSLSLQSYDEVQCRPGPLLRYGEGNLLDRTEFRPFLIRWRDLVAQSPEVADRLSEVVLHRNGNIVFFTQGRRLRIELDAGVRSWPHTLLPLLQAIEANGWSQGFVDLKDEDALLIQSRY